MKVRSIAVWIMIFAAGFATAWLAKPAGTTTGRDPSDSKSKQVVTKKVRSADEAESRHLGELIDTLKDARSDEAKSKDALAQVGIDEFPRLFEEISRRAGFNGLDYEDQSTLRNLLMDWYQRAPDKALDWVLNTPKARDRESFLDSIIGAVLEKDFQQGLAMLHQYGQREDGDWSFPYQLNSKLGTLGQDELINLLGSFVSTGSRSSMTIDVPQDFNFQKALDELTALEKGLKDGESLALTPSNFLTEWAKRDPHAAWEWTLQNKDTRFADPEEFFEGYRSVASPAEFMQLLTETTVSSDKEGSERFRVAWMALSDESDRECVGQFLQSLPGDRETNLRDLLEISTMGSGGGHDEFKRRLLQQMTPAERMNMLSAQFKEDGADDYERRVYEPALRRLGHTEDEIQRMLPKPTKEE